VLCCPLLSCPITGNNLYTYSLLIPYILILI
jgi:hypothetical protein